MPGLDDTGPQGRGPMTGGGRGYCNPRGMLTGLQRNLPRRGMPDFYPYWRRAYGFEKFSPPSTREEELRFLKNEARSLNDELKDLEASIQELETKI